MDCFVSKSHIINPFLAGGLRRRMAGASEQPLCDDQMSLIHLAQVRSAVRKRWHRWQDKHSIRARVARAMSIPTSPTRVSFHSIKQSTAV